MAASAAIPKDLPREAEVNVDERQRLNHTAAEHTSSSDDDEDEDEEDEGDEHEELHGHSHAHGGGGHQHSHGHSHAHYDDDEHRPHVRFSETPAGGLLLHILQSIPLVTSVLLRLLPATNAIAGLLALFHLLGPSTHSACSVSLLPPSGAADYGRVLLSLLFDNSYASCLASLFAVYELGSRLETLKSSFHFLLLTLTYLLATAAAYYLLLLYVPALLAFPCSVGFWPVVIALAVTESLHNPLEPRSFPLFPYAIPPLSYPLLLLLAQQLLFAIHPFPIVALPLAYVLHFPLRVVVRGLSVALERSGGVAWLGGRDGYIAVGKAGTMPPWAPIHLVAGESLPAGDSTHTSPEPVVLSDARESDSGASTDRKSPRRSVHPQSGQSSSESGDDDGAVEWKNDSDVERGGVANNTRSLDRSTEQHKLLQASSG